MSLSEVKFSFTGHESFHCRYLWLKKGYDFARAGKNFKSEDAVISLGVGKNMVNSIYFWLKAFGLIDKAGCTTDFADYIFGTDGKDPYLEDEATLWLLHYKLITSGTATIYHLIFNEFRREKIEFTREHFVAFTERKSSEYGVQSFNKKTISSDFDVFVKMYVRSAEHLRDKENSFSGLLTDLNLIKEEKKVNSLYSIPNDQRKSLPQEILLYAILENKEFQNSISLNTLSQDRNQVGPVFAITKNALMEKIESISINPAFKKFGLTLSDHAGVKELQLSSKPNKFEVLNLYYGK